MFANFIFDSFLSFYESFDFEMELIQESGVFSPGVKWPI